MELKWLEFAEVEKRAGTIVGEGGGHKDLLESEKDGKVGYKEAQCQAEEDKQFL